MIEAIAPETVRKPGYVKALMLPVTRPGAYSPADSRGPGYWCRHARLRARLEISVSQFIQGSNGLTQRFANRLPVRAATGASAQKRSMCITLPSQEPPAGSRADSALGVQFRKTGLPFSREILAQ